MKIHIQRRAEIALRSLQKMEQRQLSRAFNELSSLDRALLFKNPKLRKILTGIPEQKLFVYRGTTRLRLILSLVDDQCIVEDIVDHDRLDRLVAKWEQE